MLPIFPLRAPAECTDPLQIIGGGGFAPVMLLFRVKSDIRHDHVLEETCHSVGGQHMHLKGYCLMGAKFA